MSPVYKLECPLVKKIYTPQNISLFPLKIGLFDEGGS